MSPITRNSAGTLGVGVVLRRSCRLESNVGFGSRYVVPSAKEKGKRISNVLSVKKMPIVKGKRISKGPGEREITVVFYGPHTDILPEVAIRGFGKPNHVSVDSNLKIRTLKTILKPILRIPKQYDILIMAPNTPTPRLLKDHLTLSQSGIKNGDSLLVCRDGPIFINVLNNQFYVVYGVPLPSCFSTVAEVKNEITISTCWPAEQQIITTLENETPLEDNTTMASLGIFSPYSYAAKSPSPPLRVKFTS